MNDYRLPIMEGGSTPLYETVRSSGSAWEGRDPGSRILPVSDDLPGLGYDHGPDGLVRTSRRSIRGRLNPTR